MQEGIYRRSCVILRKVTMQAMMDELYELSGAPYLAPSALTPDGLEPKNTGC